MKKNVKNLFIAIIIVFFLLILFLIVFYSKPASLCGTSFYIRDVDTGQCKIYVGCSLPANITEDPACIDILKT